MYIVSLFRIVPLLLTVTLKLIYAIEESWMIWFAGIFISRAPVHAGEKVSIKSSLPISLFTTNSVISRALVLSNLIIAPPPH